MRAMRFTPALFVLVAAASAAAQPPAPAAQRQSRGTEHQTAAPDLLKNFTWRSVGPAGAGGRIVDVAVAGDSPQTIYVGAATGGVWRSTNEGTSWTPVFDHEAVASIGAVAVDPSNPDTIWVGSGEANPRNSVSWGDGVYKSADGGRSWANLGLKDTQHIGRVVIDPRQPNTVYVAALGHIWGPNRERGVFKTTDGGATWTSSLFVDENTGVIDLAMDPRDSNTLYAAAYEVRRDGFAGGDPAKGWGPGSGLYKTTDAGRTWRRLATGLPRGRSAGSASRSPPPIPPSSTRSCRRRRPMPPRARRRQRPAASARRPEDDEGRRPVPLRRSRRDVDVGQRDRSAPVLPQPGPRRPDRREPPVRPRQPDRGIARRRAARSTTSRGTSTSTITRSGSIRATCGT